jgi:hypothetical protein
MAAPLGPGAIPGAATGAGSTLASLKKDTSNFFKSITEWSIIPSWSELIIFLLLATLFILWIILMHYTSVQRNVRSSRCYIEQNKYSTGSIYKVQANDPNNNPLYSVTYDLGAKRFNHSCDCPAGNVLNHWKNIPIFDLKTGQADSNGLDKTCTCNKAYDTKTVYYRGNSGLVRFMNNKKDTSFFDKQDI